METCTHIRLYGGNFSFSFFRHNICAQFVFNKKMNSMVLNSYAHLCHRRRFQCRMANDVLEYDKKYIYKCSQQQSRKIN